jgi:curved DNA-binding protein CbpA
VSDYDLYELLGVERSSPQSEIKAAYRSLQKRCHPDVAGAAGGHDMAVVLNEVYALLSDPAARLAYDQEQARRSEFAGYTGRPLYSSWLGPESERRAVFVDEVRCVGCLKCALHASRTFAIESVYGRARAVAQWADDEDRIVDAINTCPVDCISYVIHSRIDSSSIHATMPIN